jgi:pimeloyl-[acyl-carrier protein] synthase
VTGPDSTIENAATVSEVVASDDYRLFCEGRLADPYPLLGWLRRNDPVHFSPRLNAWIMTRYDDVLAGLLDRTMRNDRIAASMSALPANMQSSCAPLGEHVSNWLGYTDPPKHTRLRGRLRTTFTPSLAKALSSRIVQLADELIGAMLEQEQPDLVSSFAFPLPARVIGEVLGIPTDDLRDFQRWSDAMVAFTGHIGPTLVEIAPRAMDSYLELEEFIEKRAARRSNTDGLIARLVEDERSGEMSREEVTGLSVFTLVAGHETTASLLANGLLMLLDDEQLRNRLVSQPDLFPAAIEEFLRLEAPIQFSPRLAGDTFERRGKTIRRGDAVVLHLGAANRDPERFPDADRVDLMRSDNRHLSFAWGLHFCLGAPLARAEAAIALPRLLERMSDFRRVDDVVLWRENMSIRAPAELRVARP